MQHEDMILMLIGKLKGRRPLPIHLDYMVTIVNRLSVSPKLVCSIVPHVPHVRMEHALAYFEIKLPYFKDLEDGIRWIDAQVFDHGDDLREALTPEEMKEPTQ